jgi:hypothetical protein
LIIGLDSATAIATESDHATTSFGVLVPGVWDSACLLESITGKVPIQPKMKPVLPMVFDQKNLYGD